MNPPGACTTLPALPKVWDGSRISMAVCWRKHYLGTVRGLRRKGVPSIHLTWGKAYHACTELFDNARVAGRDGALEALQLAFELSWDAERGQPFWGEWFTLYRCADPEMRPHKRDPDKLVPRKASERCPNSLRWVEDVPRQHRKCSACGASVLTVQKWLPEHKKKTRASLLRAVALYCDTPELAPYAFADPAEPVTEVQHSIPLPLNSPDGDPYQLLVNLDSIVDLNGWAAIRERKTTGIQRLDWRFWELYEMGPQVDTYDLAGRVVYPDEDRPPKLLVEITQLGSGAEVNIIRQVINIPEGRAEEHLREVVELVAEAAERTERASASGEWEAAFPRRTAACHGRFGTCAFWALCSAAPAEREGMIAADYEVNHWNPLTAKSANEEIDDG